MTVVRPASGWCVTPAWAFAIGDDAGQAGQNRDGPRDRLQERVIVVQLRAVGFVQALEMVGQVFSRTPTAQIFASFSNPLSQHAMPDGGGQRSSAGQATRRSRGHVSAACAAGFMVNREVPGGPLGWQSQRLRASRHIPIQNSTVVTLKGCTHWRPLAGCLRANHLAFARGSGHIEAHGAFECRERLGRARHNRYNW